MTLSIIKPNAVKQNVIGKIIQEFEDQSMKVSAVKMVSLDQSLCEAFYEEHKKKPFFNDLVKFMCSGPVLVMALSGENAIQKNRDIMGATDPKKAKKNTLRFKYGKSIERNALHGSDSQKSAKRELSLFFKPKDYVNL